MHPLAQETSLMSRRPLLILAAKLHSEHIMFLRITALPQPVGLRRGGSGGGGERKAIRPMLPLTLSPFFFFPFLFTNGNRPT